MKIVKAMGYKDGDYLQLANQWAKVTIEREHAERGGRNVWVYVVRGDLLDTRASSKLFHTPAEAMTYALTSLWAYRDGSPNK